MRKCEVRDLGRIPYGPAFALQRQLVEARKQGRIPDQLLLLEHPHTITLGRNGHMENLLAGEAALQSAGIEFHETNRGGDITYHGPGQIVGYPIFDLREWRRDVVGYVRAIEEVLIGTLSQFGIAGMRVPGCTGVWVCDAQGVERKVAAIGVHISRWVSSHGFALNVNTDLQFFQYIVPCGLTRPVTSMAECGVQAGLAEVKAVLAGQFGRVFDCHPESIESVLETAI